VSGRLLHIRRAAVPAVLGEFARVVRPDGELYLFVAEGDGENWEVASKYGSTRRRWFTYHRVPGVTAMLVAAGFEVRQVRQSRSSREWLSILNCRT